MDIKPEALLKEEHLQRVVVALEYYRDCREALLDLAVSELEALDINFFVYINTTDIHARKKTKHQKKEELEGRECGLCYDPILECDC